MRLDDVFQTAAESAALLEVRSGRHRSWRCMRLFDLGYIHLPFDIHHVQSQYGTAYSFRSQTLFSWMGRHSHVSCVGSTELRNKFKDA